MSSAIGKCLVAALLFYFLFFFGLTSAGLVGPDEPRYASIAREMARSGDWVTPRLWGEAWFEKPPLLYWMGAAAFRMGLGDDLAPRLPVALLSTAFLLFFFWIVRREFNEDAALYSSVILATSAGWLGYSHAATTDLPMSACFSAAMLLSLGWFGRAERRLLVLSGAMLGFAMLGKGLVPLVLAAPLVVLGIARAWEWRWGVLAFGAVAAPWYALCTAINGRAFLNEFFLRHHFERFSSDTLQHVQPFWFYLPVLLGGLFPWTPAIVLVARRVNWHDPRRRLVLLWLLWGLVFFSASTNKLPGYVLPLLPAVALLAGLGIAESQVPRRWLAAAVALLALEPILAEVLPQAMAVGLSRVHITPSLLLRGLPALLLAAGVAFLRLTPRRALAVVAVSSVVAIASLKVIAMPLLDREASARLLWRDIAARRSQVCVEEIHRAWRYGLNYYSVVPLRGCADAPARWRVVQNAGERPAVREAAGQ